jgi:hypothetical protein
MNARHVGAVSRPAAHAPSVGKERDICAQTSHEEVVGDHLGMLRCRRQTREDVGLCIGGAGAAELAEFIVEKRVETHGVPARQRLVELKLKRSKLVEK